MVIGKKSKKQQTATSSGVVVGNGGPGLKRFRFKLSKTYVLLLAVVIVVVGGLAVYTFVVLAPKKTALKSDFCTDDSALIEQYNKTVREQGVAKLQDVTAKLGRKKVDGDITCVYMQMVAQYGDATTNGENETYKKFKELDEQGKRVSDKINDNINREQLEQIIQRQIDESSKDYYGEG